MEFNEFAFVFLIDCLSIDVIIFGCINLVKTNLRFCYIIGANSVKFHLGFKRSLFKSICCKFYLLLLFFNIIL